MDTLLRELHGDAAERSPLALPAGIELAGHYRIGRLLGRPGGFGLTYLALDTVLRRLVAVKEFFPRELVGRSADATTISAHGGLERRHFEFGLRRFVEEGRVLAAIDHPNVVKVVELFEAHGTAYLVMEYQRGAPLDEALAATGGRLERELAVAIGREILAGLAAAHAAGVLHCDVKPANLYLTAAGRVVLLDFGAARRSLSEQSATLAQASTPGYAPLELLQESGRLGAWTDVYSAAATIFQLLLGERPPHVTDRLTDDPLDAADGPLTALPPGLAAALRLALVPSDRGRTATAPAFAGDLAPWALDPVATRARIAQLAGTVPGSRPDASAPGGPRTETLTPATPATRAGLGGARTRLQRALLGGVLAIGALGFLRWSLSRTQRAGPAQAQVSVREAPAQAATPDPLPVGRLVVRAAPWAEILAIVDDSGRSVAEAIGRTTPVAFELPAGRYQLRVRAPRSGRESNHEVVVESGGETRFVASIERLDALAYFEAVGW